MSSADHESGAERLAGLKAEFEALRAEALGIPDRAVLITKAQQDDLVPVLGQAATVYGKEAGDFVMAAYRIGRLHERGEVPAAGSES